MDRIRTAARPALRREFSALSQVTNQLDLFSQGVQNYNIESDAVDAGIHRLENILRRSLEGRPKEMGLLLGALKLLKDQLTGFIRDRG